MLQVIFVIGGSILIAWLWFRFRNRALPSFKESHAEFNDAENYTIVPGHHILVNSQGYIALKNPSMPEFAVIHVADIRDMDVVKNGKFHGGIIGTIGGALSFGIVGSIVGSIIGGSDRIHQFALVFISTHQLYPVVQIEFLDGSMKSGGFKDRLLSSIMERLIENLMRIENKNR